MEQAETDRLVKLKELELEEKRLGQQSNLRKILTVIWLVLSLLILGVVIVRWTADASGFGTAFLMLFYLGGPVIGGGAYLIFHVLPEKEEERRLSKSGGIRFPSGLTPFSDKQYTVIEEALLSAGFKNVRSVNLHDLNVFTALVNNGKVDTITANCRSVKHRLHKAQRAQSRERWRFAKQIRPDLDCGKKAIQWEGAVRQALPNSLGYFVLLRACARRLYHITPAYFASTWLGDCIPRHVMMWSLDCRWYTASCFLPSSRLYIRMCR